MKTSELTGAALNWAVAKAEGELPRVLGNHTVTEFEAGLRRYLITITAEVHDDNKVYAPSTNWSQGGLIIEREKISVWSNNSAHYPNEHSTWQAVKKHIGRHHNAGRNLEEGDTPLIAAMRCYVASKLGDEVEIPKEIQK